MNPIDSESMIELIEKRVRDWQVEKTFHYMLEAKRYAVRRFADVSDESCVTAVRVEPFAGNNYSVMTWRKGV
jgi:hypothetical protein